MNMLNTYYKVKRTIFLLVLLILSGTSFKAKAQQSDIRLTIEVIDANPQADDGAIIINVDSGGSGFTYMIYDKEPWKGGEKLLPDIESGTSYSYTELKIGNYYVCVQNRDEVAKCKNVTIKPRK